VRLIRLTASVAACLPILASGGDVFAQQTAQTQSYQGNAPSLSEEPRATTLPALGGTLPRQAVPNTNNDANAAGLRSGLQGTDPNNPNGVTPGRPTPWADSISQYQRPSSPLAARRPSPIVAGNPNALSAPMADRHTGKVKRPPASANGSASRPGSSSASGTAAARSAATPVVPTGPTAARRPAPLMRPVDVPIVYEADQLRGAQRPVPNVYANGAHIDPQTGQIVVANRPRPVIEDDPYAPTGVRAGAFVLKPSFEVMEGYDTNPARAQAGSKGSTFTQVTAEGQAQSQWQRHELTAKLRASYSAYLADANYSRPDVAASLGGRIDVRTGTRIEWEGRYGLTSQTPGSADLTSATAARLTGLPLIHQIGASLGAVEDIQTLRFSLRGTLDHYGYEMTRYSNAPAVSNDDRNYWALGTKARATYARTPGLMPFVEVGQEKRVFDNLYDRSAVKRGSQAFNGRVGAQIELTRMVTGEASVGYESRSYEDPSLKTFGGLLFDSSLIWTPTGLSTVTFTAKTATDETTLAGANGILRRDVSLRIDHAFRRYLIGTGQIAYGQDQFIGLSRNDNRLSGGLGLTYKANRWFSLRGDWRYEQLASTDPTAGYGAHVFMLGAKAAR